jgi:hypothetical protein
MLTRLIAAAAALSLVASPAMAAELHEESASGARRSGALAGAYVRLALDGPKRAERPVAGLRLAAVHDYRDALAPRARLFQADTLDLRLTGPAPALYLSGRPITGRAAAKLEASGGGGGRLDTVLLAGAGLLALGAGIALVLSAD